MSHLLNTVNPDAAERINQGVGVGPVAPAVQVNDGWGSSATAMPADLPVQDGMEGVMAEPLEFDEPEAMRPVLPGVGSLVLYHLRLGDWQSRRNVFPALVTRHNADDGTIDLTVMIEVDDVMAREYVKPWNGLEPGWELTEDAKAIRSLVASFNSLAKFVCGDFIVSDDDPSLMMRLTDLYKKIEARGGNAAPEMPPVVYHAAYVKDFQSIQAIHEALNGRLQVVEATNTSAPDLAESLASTNAALGKALQRIAALETAAATPGSVTEPARAGRRKRS